MDEMLYNQICYYYCCVILSRDLISLCALFSDLVLLLFKKKKKKNNCVCVLISIPIRAALTHVSSRETNAHRSLF
jgi:hypothetical protein